MPPLAPAPAPGITAKGTAVQTAPVERSAEREEIKQAAQAFEAIMLRQLLSSARATDFGGENIMGGQSMEQFTAMRDEHLADIASRTGAFGLAASIETQLAAMKGMR